MERVTHLERHLFGVLLLASAAFFTVVTVLPGDVRGTIQSLVCSVLLWVRGLVVFDEEAETLHLNGLRELSVEVAKELSKWEKEENYLYPNGLTDPSKETAKKVALSS